MAKSTKSDTAGEPAPKKKQPGAAAGAAAPAAKKAAGGAAPAPKKAACGAAPAPKKAATAGKKSAKSDRAPAAAGSPASLAPPIDTGLAAQAAASMIANRAVAGLGAAAAGAPQGGGQQAGAKQESATFKNLKESLSKPPVGGLGAILGGGGGDRKSNQGFGGPKPSVPGGAKNQTFGADVNRSGVPRRTGG
jgi:hypothetical protein